MYGEAIKYKAKEVLKDDALAEDCMHDVMLKLSCNLEVIGEYGSSQAKALIYRITSNHAIDMLRSRKHEVLSEMPEKEQGYIENTYSIFDDSIGEYGYDRSLDDYLENLDEVDRAIVGMKYDYGMKHKDIAALLGKSVTAIDKRSERIKIKIIQMKLERDKNEED